MIKNWSKFNESTSESFTEEMAQEIIYFFGENSTIPAEMKDIFEEICNTYGLDMDLYEVDYDEMKDYTKDLFNGSKESQELTKELIGLYDKIRKEIGVFPEVCQIEDIYLSIIEELKYDFYLIIDSIGKQIIIKLENRGESELDKFIQTCKIVEGSLKRLKSDKYTTHLYCCSYTLNLIEFKISLKA